MEAQVQRLEAESSVGRQRVQQAEEKVQRLASERRQADALVAANVELQAQVQRLETALQTSRASAEAACAAELARMQAEADAKVEAVQAHVEAEQRRARAAEGEVQRLIAANARLKGECDSGKREWDSFVRTRADILQQRLEAEKELKRALDFAVRSVEAPIAYHPSGHSEAYSAPRVSES